MLASTRILSYCWRTMAGSERDKLIGRNVATLRADVSQQALADAMRARGHRWSQATVWSVEKGDRPLKLDEAIDLARVVECDVGQLWAEPALVAMGKVLHRNWLEVDELAIKLEDAAVRYEHGVRVLNNRVVDAIERGLAGDWAGIADDREALFPATASEAVSGDRLTEAWHRLAGHEGVVIPGRSSDGEHQETP